MSSETMIQFVEKYIKDIRLLILSAGLPSI
jgi:hypothetical protein